MFGVDVEKMLNIIETHTKDCGFFVFINRTKELVYIMSECKDSLRSYLQDFLDNFNIIEMEYDFIINHAKKDIKQ